MPVSMRMNDYYILLAACVSVWMFKLGILISIYLIRPFLGELIFFFKFCFSRIGSDLIFLALEVISRSFITLLEHHRSY